MLDRLFPVVIHFILLVLQGLLVCQSAVAGEATAGNKSDDELVRELDGQELETVVIKAGRINLAQDSSAFAERLTVKNEIDRMRSVSDVLSDAVGVQVRRLGGLGSYGAASIRGSTPNQVPVYLDGVLLNAGGFDSVNLGDLSLDSLAEIDIFRGQTPASLGTAGIGGALVLKTRSFERPLLEIAASCGSWNSYRLYSLLARRFAFVKLLALLSLSSSRGDFFYLNRNGTLFDSGDDRIIRRQNNANRTLAALLKLESEAGEWNFRLSDDFHGKLQGVAGIESLPTQEASLSTMRNLLDLRAAGTISDRLLLELNASHLFLFENFDDSYGAHGELGLKRQHTITDTHALALGAEAKLETGTEHFSTAGLELRWERLTSRDEVDMLQGSPKSRLRAGLALGHVWNPADDFFVQPGLRLSYLHSSFGGGTLPGGLGDIAPVDADDFVWQASLGTRWEIGCGLTIRANAGRYVRFPDLTEMFGDRGATIGNPDLLPERGINADAGLGYLLIGQGPLTMLRAGAAWFGNWSDDLISYVQNSQSSVRPENVSAAEILGLECSLRASLWNALSLSANYTYMHAVNRSQVVYYRGKRLPGRPAHEIYGKIEFGRARSGQGLRLWADVDYAGNNYLDQANLKEDVLARLLFGAGLSLEDMRRGLVITVEVKNLTDSYVLTDADGGRRPLRDFEAFPLPGRTVMATVRWRI
ncbi:MAG TPA: TonB-dependent receptor [Myxococcota bacterium]|nr:TonB-dependent receptor [Myxococcota bacterium]